MARWLVADNPVQFWSEGELVPGYMHHRGNWVEGRGYFTACNRGQGRTYAIGWLQLDGVFCTAGVDSNYRYTDVHDDATKDGTNEVLVQHGRYLNTFDSYWLSGGLSSTYWEKEFFHQRLEQDKRRSLMRANDDATENFLCIKNGRVQTNTIGGVYGGGFQDQTGDVWDPLPDDSDYCNITWKGGDEFYIFHKTGIGAIYNHNTKEIVRNDLWVDDLSSFNRAYVSYCREHDLFIAICKENLVSEPISNWRDTYLQYYDRNVRIRIYLNAGRPVTLSTPIALTSLQVGVVSEIEVTVQGSQSDAVEGHLVDWRITSGEGSLTLTQSVTGINGKATTGYLPPATDGGSVTIEAEIVY